jgi:hypothetical protein
MSITQQAKQLYGAYNATKEQEPEKKPQIEGRVIGKKPLLFIDVDIGENEQDRITVFQGDNPRDLAEKFCLKHTIEDTEIVTVLEKQLQEKIRKIEDIQNKEQLPQAVQYRPREITVQDMTTPEPQSTPPVQQASRQFKA